MHHDVNVDAKSWCLSVPSGEAPSRRTCHSAAAIDNRLFIFGGGQSGAEPVHDDKLYVYNASEEKFSVNVKLFRTYVQLYFEKIKLCNRFTFRGESLVPP